MNSKVCSFLLRYIPENGLILDAGCGYFRYATFVRKYNDNVICTDLYNLNADEAKGSKFLLSSVESLPFKDKSFQFIYSLSVIQLIKNDVAVLDEFYRILKSGGNLFFTVPTKWSVFMLLRELEIACGVYKYREFNVKHYHYYTRYAIRELASGRFKLKCLHGYGYNYLRRLYSFLIAICMAFSRCLMFDGALRRARNRFRKNNRSSSKHRKDLGKEKDPYIETSNKLELFQKKFPLLNDLAYHYIVVLEKK